MTECGPLSHISLGRTKLYSCGKAVPRMEIKIDSHDPKNIPGEILCKGANFNAGILLKQEATDAVMTEMGG